MGGDRISVARGDPNREVVVLLLPRGCWETRVAMVRHRGSGWTEDEVSVGRARGAAGGSEGAHLGSLGPR